MTHMSTLHALALGFVLGLLVCAILAAVTGDYDHDR